MPGGGAGRRDVVGRSGVYRVSGPPPRGDAPIVGMASWGQGSRGAEGYGDHGESELFYRPVTPEKCRDIMTKDPWCCVPADTAAQAARLMKRHDVGVLPVVEDRAGKKLLGVVTDRDMALRVVAGGLDPSAVAVKLVMSKPAITCAPDDGCETAADLMEKHRIRRVFVTDQSGRVVGVIAESDIALRLRNLEVTGEVVACVSQPDPARV
jgi:CBS domain-containing protein